jgi:hypothetical protein
LNTTPKHRERNVRALFGWMTLGCVAVAAFRWSWLHDAPTGVTMLLFAAAVITMGGTIGALIGRARIGAMCMAAVAVACLVLPLLWQIRGAVLEIIVIGAVVALLVASHWPLNWNDRRIH